MEQLEIIRSKRRSICIVVQASFRMKGKDILRFVDEKQAWIEEPLQITRTHRTGNEPAFSTEEICALRGCFERYL